MAAPSDVLNLVNGLEDDRQDVLNKTTAKAAADAAVVAATQQAAAAANDLTASKAHLAADLQAAHAKLEALYSGDVTVPANSIPATPPAATPAPAAAPATPAANAPA